MSWIFKSALAGLVAASIMVLIGPSSAFASLPTGEHAHGNVSIEPAYDDMTGNIVYLQTPNKHAPLNPDNPTSHVNPHAVAPLYIVVYPPATPGTFNCMGVPGNCPDHDSAIASVATSTEPLVYGTDPSLVPGHDHLVGVANTGGDFNAAWHVFVEVFTPGATITHITTLAQLQTAWASGSIDATASGQGIDTGITFLCAVVSQSSYNAGTPVG
jgi:hypothetical protein